MQFNVIPVVTYLWASPKAWVTWNVSNHITSSACTALIGLRGVEDDNGGCFHVYYKMDQPMGSEPTFWKYCGMRYANRLENGRKMTYLRER